MELKTRREIKVKGKEESILIIIPLNENEIWVADERDRNLTLIDRNGRVIRESANLCKTFIYDAKKYGNDILVTCYLVPKILRLSRDGGSVSSFYDTSPFITMGLCVTDNQQVLLCLKSEINVLDKRAKVVRIDSEGKELQTIDSESADVRSFFWPDRIIALKDDVTIVINDTSPNRLLFFNKEGRKFREWDGYAGKNQVHIGCITHKNDKIFMTDRRAKSVYVLNTDGTGARCLIDGTKEGLLLPCGIAFNHGQLLVGSWDGTITIFEYPQYETGSFTFTDVEEYLRTVASQEDVKARNIRIMLVGNEQVGKTSLCKNMLEEKLPDGGPERTDGIDIYIERFVIDMVTNNRNKIPAGAEHQNILQKLSDSVQRHQVQRLHSDTTRSTDEEERNTDLTNQENVIRDDNDQKNLTDTSSERNKTSSSIGTPEVIYARDQKQNDVGNEGKPPDISSEESIANSLPEGLYDDWHHVLTQPEAEVPHDKCYASFWDFSGENDYYNTHHIFLTSDAVYLLVFKLSDCLNTDEWLERMVFWLRSIAAYSVENVAEKRKCGPPIILIGTHLDQLQGTPKEINVKINEMYMKLIKDKTARQIVSNHVQGFYQISNTGDNKQVITQIWDSILSSAPLQSQWERKLPCLWLERERVLMKRKAMDVKIQKFADIKQINQHLQQQQQQQDNTDTDVKMFLRYMHLTGDIIVSNINRPDEAIIVIDPQWLVHAFRHLITSPKKELPFCGGRFGILWPMYEYTAVLPMELIEMAWEKDEEKGFMKFKNELLSIMEKFGLVAHVLWDEDKGTSEEIPRNQASIRYIVPCMLPKATPNVFGNVLKKENVTKTCALCFVFKDNFIQLSVFDKIIASCMQKFEPFTDDSSDKFKYIQRGCVCLHLTHVWNVIICCKYAVLKVMLFKFSTARDIEQGVGCHIREILEALIQNVWAITYEGKLEFEFELHNDFRICKEERRITPEKLGKTEEFYCSDMEGQWSFLHKKDCDAWFTCTDERMKDEEFDKHGIRKDILDERVTETAISDLSSCIGNTFYLLFIELGLSMPEIDQVLLDRKFPNFRTMILKLLHMWSCGKGEEATYRMLYQAMLKHDIKIEPKLPDVSGSGELLGDFAQSEPTEKEMALIAKYIDSNFYMFFIALGLQFDTIEKMQIDYSHLNSESMYLKMLAKWVHIRGKEATIGVVLRALKKHFMKYNDFLSALYSGRGKSIS